MSSDSLLILKQIANNLLFSDYPEDVLDQIENADLVEKIEMEFQKELRQFYKETEFAKETEKLKESKSKVPLDEQALHLLAKYTEGGDDVPQITRQLPKFSKKHNNSGYECTLSTALMRIALEKLGYESRSVLLRRHFVAIRELADGSIKFYDAANRSTIDGEIKGFTHTFTPDEIFDKKDLGNNHHTFIVKTNSEIQGTDMFSEKDKDGFYTKRFFAYNPNILIPLHVVLENLAEYKKQNDKHSVDIFKKYPYLKDLYYKKLKRDLKLFDGYGYI